MDWVLTLQQDAAARETNEDGKSVHSAVTPMLLPHFHGGNAGPRARSAAR
jgi:hypothetical protein